MASSGFLPVPDDSRDAWKHNRQASIVSGSKAAFKNQLGKGSGGSYMCQWVVFLPPPIERDQNQAVSCINSIAVCRLGDTPNSLARLLKTQYQGFQ
jgi:hypothetical protein